MDKNGQRMDNLLSLDLKLQGLIGSKIKHIDQFNSTWSEIELTKTKAFLRELKELSTIQSIGSSTRIEGSMLRDDEIKILIANLDISKLKSRDEEEVSGYYEVLDLIYENYQNLFLSESYIKQLHAILLQYSSKDTRHRGEYKSLSNKVVAKYPDGSSRVIFDTTEPYLVAKEMADLIDWSNERLSYSGVAPLMVIAVFVYEFLSIHPFQDGNGRLSRLLTNLLMMKSGYKFIQYISFEHVIEQRKKEYYQNLMEAQSKRFTKDENLGLWMIYFFDCIENLIVKLQTKLNSNPDRCLDELPVNLGSRQKQIYTFIRANESSKVENLMEYFPDITRPTIKYSLSRLVDLSLISRNGRGRGTWYQAANQP